MKKIRLTNNRMAILLIAAQSLVFVSCEDYLDQNVEDQLTTEFFFQTPAHFESAANYFYTNLDFGQGDRDTQRNDESSDLSGNISAAEPYARGGGTTLTTQQIWNDNYFRLRPPNDLLIAAENYGGDPSEIQESVGAAYFFRAWHHYILLKRFGGVPLALTSPNTNDVDAIYAPRNSRYEVVFQIVQDLNEAIDRLPSAEDIQQGQLSIEAAKSFKARVLLYEATWDKYVGEATDGDGTSSGAGSAKPVGYPSVKEMLAEAQQEALDVMNSGAFDLWDYRDEIGERHLFYLFNLEDGSNPIGLNKVDNNEFIFQTVYDFTLRQTRLNITQAKPYTPSRKLMDMYLCTDGLPVQHSSVFEGYDLMASEFQNRDHRLKSFVPEPLVEYWGYGLASDGGGAQYGVAFEDSGQDFNYQYVPTLLGLGGGRNIGYSGRKFVTENIGREVREESHNYPLIRLAEVMLIYAEATVELGEGSISDSDLDISINRIRERSGVAPLTNALIAPFGDLNMLGEIRRERAIELFGEGFRFDDLKRWNLATTELNRTVCLTYIEDTEFETAISPISDQPIYDASGFPNGLTTAELITSSYSGIATTKPGALILDPAGNRNFTLKNYLDPLPTDQINLNPDLVQNPEW